jgi:phosphoribosylanthranilate isomerase
LKVKICGLTNIGDAILAKSLGADLLGFLFAEESPRFVGKENATRIIHQLPIDVDKVGLFKDHDIKHVAECIYDCGLTAVQLHGVESPEYCGSLKSIISDMGRTVKLLKTFKVKDRIMGRNPNEYPQCDYYLFDTYHPTMMGGTGMSFDWKALKGFKSDKPFFIAGGLTPENVEAAINEMDPYGVDVASGVEVSPGKKDPSKIEEFIINAKKV